MIKHVIFDLGGVLIDWDPRYLFKKVFDDESEMNFFLSEVCSPAWNIQQDAGRSWQEAIRERTELYPKFENEIRMYYERWTEMLGGVIEGSLQILNELQRKKGADIYALTNWSEETFGYAVERYDFLSSFHGIVVSGIVKKIKPDPDIYFHLANTFNIDLKSSLFIDDNEQNILTAKKLGMHVIHFSTPEQLKQELEQFKIR